MSQFDKDAVESSAQDKKQKEIKSAVHAGNVIQLRQLLENATLHQVNSNLDGWCLIHTAVEYGNVEIAEELKKFAEKHNKNVLVLWDQLLTFHRRFSHAKLYAFPGPEVQQSLLVIAIKNKQQEMIKYLVPLYKEIKEETFGIFEALLESLCKPKLLSFLCDHFPDYINKKFEGFPMLLLEAIRMEKVKSIRVLLDHQRKLTPNWLQIDGIAASAIKCATEHASCTNNFEILKLLISAGADLNSCCCDDTSYNLRSMSPTLPLFIAVAFGSLDLVKFLIEKGANQYICQNGFVPQAEGKNIHFNVSAPFLAAFGNKLIILNYFLTIFDKNKAGRINLTSPVVAAAMRQSPACLKVLLEAGFSADGLLPHNNIKTLSHPVGATMLDNLTVYVDDMEDTHRPVLNVFSMLLANGVKFTNSINVQLIQYLLFHREATSYEILRLFVKAGALEFVFGRTQGLRTFLSEEFRFVSSMQVRGDLPHPTQPWLTIKNTHLYIRNFLLMFKLLQLFEISGGDRGVTMEERVPSLKEICRYNIRCRVVKAYCYCIDYHFHFQS